MQQNEYIKKCNTERKKGQSCDSTYIKLWKQAKLTYKAMQGWISNCKIFVEYTGEFFGSWDYYRFFKMQMSWLYEKILIHLTILNLEFFIKKSFF